MEYVLRMRKCELKVSFEGTSSTFAFGFRTLMILSKARAVSLVLTSLGIDFLMSRKSNYS